MTSWAAAEFFAGIGLVRLAIERAGFHVEYANDIAPLKAAMYTNNFPGEHFACEDVRLVQGDDVPDVDLATASFPCTDLSLAGNRAGLAGAESSMFWEFSRVIEEMGERRPRVIMLENVPSFLTSHGGQDLHAAIAQLNELGYWCDLLTVDARLFVPQSRPRLFVVASQERLTSPVPLQVGPFRSESVVGFCRRFTDLDLQHHPVQLPLGAPATFAQEAERLKASDPRWWDVERVANFRGSLAPIHQERWKTVLAARGMATAYRRTRGGRAVWEIRADGFAGCLRTARGGSSKQAVLDATSGRMKIRWMTAREYARLQGAPDFELEAVSEVQAIFGFGDAVCVPAVQWIAETYLAPLVAGELTQAAAIPSAA